MAQYKNIPVTIFHCDYVGSCQRGADYLYGRMLSRGYTFASDGRAYKTGRAGFCYVGAGIADVESKFQRLVEADKIEERRQIEKALAVNECPGFTAPSV